MKRLYLFVAIFIGFSVTACTTVKNPTQPPLEKHAPKKVAPCQTCAVEQQLSMNTSLDQFKSPYAVKVYPKGINPNNPYKVLAKKSVSKYNLAGNKRPEALVHDALCDMAASMGGDAVINVTRDDSKVTGEVVAFENKKMG